MAPTENSQAGPVALKKWRYNSPFVQAMIVGATLFCGPGTYLAMTGLGAGGVHPSYIHITDAGNVVLYCIFGVAGVFGGSIINQLGPRITLMVGASGYSIYAGSLWYVDQGKGGWFNIFAGFLCGISAGLLWSTQGYITATYATEQEKGKYIATTWLFNAAGSVMGASIVLGLTATDDAISGVPPAVYITFITIECCGILVATLLMSPEKVRRDDGRPLAAFTPLPWFQELKALGKTCCEPKMLLITLSIYSSEMYLSLCGSFNSTYFNARSRALANLAYWIMQIVGSLVIQAVTDAKGYQRRHRAFMAIGLVGIVIGGTWIAMTTFLTVNDIHRDVARGVDWTDGSSFAGPLVIYMFFGMCYPLFQNLHHWLYSTFSNEPHVLARYSGFFKGVQAFGTATAFGIDSRKTPFLIQNAVYFPLMMIGLLLSTVSAYKYTSNTNYGKESGVVIPASIERELKDCPNGEEFHGEEVSALKIKG
ncbi:major facilitator superfamily domain-containing protein [Aspergillus varians]